MEGGRGYEKMRKRGIKTGDQRSKTQAQTDTIDAGDSATHRLLRGSV